LSGYFLDTNICIYALNGGAVVEDRMLAHRRSSIAISVITEAELRLGAVKSGAPTKRLRALMNFLRPIRIVPFESEDVAVYAQVRAHLEKAGTPIGALDTLIGAHAVARGRVLVTNNEGEFKRIRGLKVENWTK